MDKDGFSLHSVARAYFIGIGGIGMSALARYFMSVGVPVAGYDRVASQLTHSLEREGAHIHYDDNPDLIPADYKTGQIDTIVVYTAAIPPLHAEKSFLESSGHLLFKRAEVLGLIAKSYRTVAIAGTHGKTTTSSLIAHLLHQTVGCTAFLGGIASNYSSNLILDKTSSDLLVAEADEYDRSFLQLYPDVLAITSFAPDHLDIYGSTEDLLDSFLEFAQHSRSRTIIVNKSIEQYFSHLHLNLVTYGWEQSSDYWAENLSYNQGRCEFDLHCPSKSTHRVKMQLVGRHNVENTMAAIACIEQAGIQLERVLQHVFSFSGVKRRFDILYKTNNLVYIDDYAHHPDEIRATISTVRTLYPNRAITGIFQPHLYSRTRDFLSDFASALSGLDTLFLLPIYAARENPIHGITSQSIIDLLPQNMDCRIVDFSELLNLLSTSPVNIILAMGAGDIGTYSSHIIDVLKSRECKG